MKSSLSIELLMGHFSKVKYLQLVGAVPGAIPILWNLKDH
jgi:hypothetical protein